MVQHKSNKSLVKVSVILIIQVHIYIIKFISCQVNSLVQL